MKTRVTNLLILALATSFIGCSMNKPFWSGSGQKLEGDWACTYAVVDGKPVSDSKVQILRLTLTDKRYTTTMGPETLFDSTYTTNPTKTPK